MTEQAVNIPQFAVIGRVNEGKSSIVSSLTENDRIVVGPDPGTTGETEVFTVRGDGRDLFTLIDTPGFEESERVLAWLTERSKSVSDRPACISSFVKTFEGSDEFGAECKLLRPILDGAAIIYVVSSNHPFRPGFEAEMEILRWTGSPRLALINRSPGVDYADEWKQALGQYFNIVKIFDAHHSQFADRMALLDAMRILDDDMAAGFDRAIRVLEDIQARRIDRAAELVATTAAEMLTFRMNISDAEDADPNKNKVVDRFHDKLRQIESDGRSLVEQLFMHSRLQRTEEEFSKPIYDQDLFAEETWQVLGMPRWVLISLGTIAGGAMGGLLDVKTAGATGFLGTPVGMLLGAASTMGATLGQPESKIKGIKIAGASKSVGPQRDPNFPWVILDRALLHYGALLGRTHAVRERLVVDANEKAGVVRQLDNAQTIKLSKALAKIRKSDSIGRHLDDLIDQLRPILWSIARDMGSAPKKR